MLQRDWRFLELFDYKYLQNVRCYRSKIQLNEADDEEHIRTWKYSRGRVNL